MKTTSFLAFLTEEQVASIPSKKVHHLIEYQEKKGAKLYWVIGNKQGTVCIEQKDSCDLFRLLHEHNETLLIYDNSQA